MKIKSGEIRITQDSNEGPLVKQAFNTVEITFRGDLSVIVSLTPSDASEFHRWLGKAITEALDAPTGIPDSLAAMRPELDQWTPELNP